MADIKEKMETEIMWHEIKKFKEPFVAKTNQLFNELVVGVS